MVEKLMSQFGKEEANRMLGNIQQGVRPSSSLAQECFSNTRKIRHGLVISFMASPIPRRNGRKFPSWSLPQPGHRW
jgi:hypothetical protein